MAKDINFSNNSFYNNGGATKQAGFRIGHSKRIVIENNALESNIPLSVLYSVDKNSSGISLSNNYAKGVITSDGSEIVGIESVNKLFNNPTNLDFSIVSNLPQKIGASSGAIAKIKEKLKRFNIKVQREHIEINQAQQSKYIVEHAPRQYGLQPLQ